MSKLENLVKQIVPAKIFDHYLDYKKRLRIKQYAGNQVVCSVCGSTFKSFAPFGRGKRQNARCLACDSLERHRLLWKYLQERTDLFQQKKQIRVMHFAPEKAFYDVLSERPNITYVPCDFVPEVYAFNGKAKIEKVDITDIPFPENHFDVILCTHVLEHIPDDNKAMSELFRVMKKGGWGVFQVPIDYNRDKTYEDFSITSPAARKKAFGRAGHVRWYGRDYKLRLANAGFKVMEDDYVKHFSREDLFKFGFIETEFIYFCQKP
jgi:SAM-dependent methyltransferase